VNSTGIDRIGASRTRRRRRWSASVVLIARQPSRSRPLGQRRAQQRVQIVVAQRVQFSVAGRALGDPEIRVSGDYLGQFGDCRTNEDLVNGQLYAVDVAEAGDESGCGQRVAAEGEKIVVYAHRRPGVEKVAPDLGEGRLDRVPGLDAASRR
jgi:hypothetical protein